MCIQNAAPVLKNLPSRSAVSAVTGFFFARDAFDPGALEKESLDCTPGMRHDNFCDRLISRMTCGSKSEKPSVSDVVQIEGDQAR
jgi:hypothetical protein